MRGTLLNLPGLELKSLVSCQEWPAISSLHDRRRAAFGVSRERASIVVRCHSYSERMAKRPSRIDLLELDIDMRLMDLWREASDVSEWNLEIVAAFMRAAYGKGYCDALTEDQPGSLCEEHGYRVPARRPAPSREAS
jgi:hypothetical protein